jgi:hypothetical protein
LRVRCAVRGSFFAGSVFSKEASALKDLTEIAAHLPPARLERIGRGFAVIAINAHDRGDIAAAGFWHELAHSLLDIAQVDRLAELLAEPNESGAILEETGDGLLAALEEWVIDGPDECQDPRV